MSVVGVCVCCMCVVSVVCVSVLWLCVCFECLVCVCVCGLTVLLCGVNHQIGPLKWKQSHSTKGADLQTDVCEQQMRYVITK